MTQQDGRKMLLIMNNLETTVELNGVLQKNIEWQKANNDTLRILVRKREDQLLSANYKLTEQEKTMFKLRVYNISITITSLFFLILLASK
jgi:hypothetical protein